MVLSQSAFLILVSSLRNGRMPLPSNRTAAISRERNDCHLARWAIRLGIRVVHSNLLRGSELTSSNLGKLEATMAAAILGSEVCSFGIRDTAQAVRWALMPADAATKWTLWLTLDSRLRRLSGE